jgi:hypothetical protein
MAPTLRSFVVVAAQVGMGATAAPAQAKYCKIAGSAEGLADLKVTRVSCNTGRAVYRRSLKVAAEHPEDVNPTTFRYAGRRWTCRASNPHRVLNGQYVDYVWRCKASGGRVVRYHWLAGD